ncbi:MAG: type III toxin-antitoxin system ToxN/AbiQ family toxin [Clostridia bacterium]|nr:type III toxin-antitoxin system ToxN/AbiQ family toxin [Clostridia bacterium]
MEKLRLYTIDVDYLQYLFNIDNRVMYWENSTYKSDRKYIGIVLRINGFEYFAPLSSPKSNDYFYKKGVKQIKKSIIPIIRLVTDKGQLLGKIKLSNMIPVKREQLTLYDIKGEPDKKYQSLIVKEMICIRKHKEEIKRNALVLYNQKTKGYENIQYLDYTLDFKALEEACLKYKKAE